MKLVDILARELKVWPENCECVWQVLSGRLAIDKDRDRLTDSTYTIARDWHEARVTRAEWQAAVDALNAPKVVEWNGAGLPPVGLDVEVMQDGFPYLAFDWQACTILAINIGSDDKPQVITRDFRGDVAIYYPDIDSVYFRPIRTAEQVAAEEREKAIKEMMMHGVDAGDSTIEYSCAALYDAGYRKEPKPCGS